MVLYFRVIFIMIHYWVVILFRTIYEYGEKYGNPGNKIVPNSFRERGHSTSRRLSGAWEDFIFLGCHVQSI